MSEPLANPQRVRILAGLDTDSLGDRPAMNRKTSTYTITIDVTRLHCPAHTSTGDNTTHHITGPSCRTCGFKPSVIRRDAVARIAAALPQVQDQGDHSVSFRAAGDQEAITIARDAGASALPLSTGLGIHRRDVTPVVI